MTHPRSNISTCGELSALKHEIKNQGMKSLPSNMTIKRRPLQHLPVASPYAGADIQKVVYVSSHTPLMSAVKRVKKLLSHAEKRGMQGAGAKRGRFATAAAIAELADASHQSAKAQEEVLVKASGRAMQQALRVGEWFRTKEKEMICKVEVRTGSVQAVDDIVEMEENYEGVETEIEDRKQGDITLEEEVTLEGGETTLELLGDTSKTSTEKSWDELPSATNTTAQTEAEDNKKSKRRRRPKRKRAKYDVDDVPEARLRWVKTVEVAISLQS